MKKDIVIAVLAAALIAVMGFFIYDRVVLKQPVPVTPLIPSATTGAGQGGQPATESATSTGGGEAAAPTSTQLMPPQATGMFLPQIIYLSAFTTSERTSIQKNIVNRFMNFEHCIDHTVTSMVFKRAEGVPGYDLKVETILGRNDNKENGVYSGFLHENVNTLWQPEIMEASSETQACVEAMSDAPMWKLAPIDGLPLPQVFFWNEANYNQTDLKMIRLNVIDRYWEYHTCLGEPLVSVQVERPDFTKNDVMVQGVFSRNDGKVEGGWESFWTRKDENGLYPFWNPEIDEKTGKRAECKNELGP